MRDAGVGITSHDVARLAGVSQPTVSRALRDQPGVSAATRGKVRDAARVLGYVTSQAGRSLATRSTGRVGVVSAELSNPFYPALLEPLHDALGQFGYRTILVTDRGEVPVELEPLIDGSLDAVILTTSETGSDLPEELRRRGVPFVLLNRTVDGVDGDVCTVDNIAGGALVADLLMSLGHERIGAILGPSTTSTGRDRRRGFQDRLAEHGRALPPKLVREGPFTAAFGRTALRELMAGPKSPTAIFCGNDVLGLGVLNACLAHGIDVPDALTVIGFDDIAMAAWECFDLTTVRVDLAAMAQSAARLLVDRIASSERPARQISLDPVLVPRGTHSAPRRASISGLRPSAHGQS